MPPPLPVPPPLVLFKPLLSSLNLYRISGNIGDIFNLAVWRSGSKSPNFYHQIHINLLTMLCPCCTTAKFNFRQFLLQPDLAQIAKFNDRLYFRIYSIFLLSHATSLRLSHLLSVLYFPVVCLAWVLEVISLHFYKTSGFHPQTTATSPL